MRGRFDDGRGLIAQARSMLDDVALTVWMAGPLTQMAGWIELLAGDAAAAERQLRRGVETLKEIGELSWLSTVAGILAEALYAQGRDDEAEEFIKVSAETAGSDDAYSQGLLRSVNAKILARRGEADEAERLGREAVEIAKATDFLFLQALTLASLGEALLLVGRRDEAERVLADAVRVCERKGFVVGAKRARELLDRRAPEPSVSRGAKPG
jgi:tetratricopeptide (TPR) repeat protein